jgi:thiamine biosynthesis lipoprotein
MKKLFWAAILTAILTLTACGAAAATETFFALDTSVSVFISGDNPQKTADSVSEAIKGVSNSAEICYETTADKALPEVSDLVLKTETLNREYGETVNIFCGELTALWGISTENPRIPTDEEIKDVLPLIPTDKSGIIPGATRLDPGAVAKGYALDRAKAAIENSPEKTEYAVITTVSSILLYGEKPSGEPFLTGIKDDKGGLAGYIKTGASFISTTGGAERFAVLNPGDIPEQVFIHILDLRTGYPSESDLASVAVIIPASEADGGIKSDFLSTAMFLTGSENLESYGVTYVAITSDGTVLSNTEVYPYE